MTSTNMDILTTFAQFWCTKIHVKWFCMFQNKASDPPKYKGDKDSMPASMRVKDAAESVLTCIIDQVVGLLKVGV